MIVNRIGNVIRLALRSRVESADDSLQFGEFADHLRSEVALREFRGAVGFGDMRLHESAVEPLLSEPAGNRARRVRPYRGNSQPGFVRDAFKLLAIVGEPTSLIRLPKELSVCQSRPQDRSCPAHQSLGIFRKIDDRKKMRATSPLRFSTAKYFDGRA